MSNRSVEKVLRRLPAVEPPATLRQHVLATIPVQAPEPTVGVSTAKPWNHRRLKPAGFVAVMVMFGLVISSIHLQQKPDGTQSPAGSIAFAQTLEAMRSVPSFHLHGRSRAYTSKQFSDWGRIDEWFDAKRGFYHKQHTPGHKAVRILLLPDGTWYQCNDLSANDDSDAYAVEVTSQSAFWELMRSFENLPQLLGQENGTTHFSTFTESKPGDWKGQAVTVFTSEIIGSSTKTSIYVHPVNRLPVAMRNWVKLSDKSDWQLTAEREFDFAEVDASYFDPKPLLDGARVIHRKVPSPKLTRPKMIRR